ncbi:MAG: septum formation initiator family protein [bacterium]|nr:septum formation initiator family protein [bacterium]
MRFLKFNTGRGLFNSPVVAALAVLAAVFLSVSAGRIVLKARAIYREREALAGRIRELQAERERSGGAIAALKPPEAVERLAKERLNLKRPGEEVVVVTPDVVPPPPVKPPWYLGVLPSWLAELLSFLGR